MNPLFETVDLTWPAAAFHRVGPWVIREGKGGGQRVSAATAEGPWSEDDIALAEAAQARLGQASLFLIRDGEERLDEALDARGYRIHDPVNLRATPVSDVAGETPWLSTFPHWPPLAIAGDIWADGGIGPARVDVMARVTGPKCAILARSGDRSAGVAFVGVAGPEAMVHALHVLPAFRRKGLAVSLMRAAANWAGEQGATRLSLAVTQANEAANGLYAFLGMPIVGQYHYRLK